MTSFAFPMEPVLAFGLGTGEIIAIVVVLVLLFGAKKIPELMRGLGSGIKEFKNAASLEEDNDKAQQKRELPDQK